MICSTLRNRLQAGAALTLAITLPVAALAVPATEKSSYTMQVMTQSFDGEREMSHSQALAYARMRRGEESWIELDFGDGGTVIESRDGTAAGQFKNTSGVEAGLRYDYATRQLSSSGTLVERFHNTFVRRQLGQGPALGADAQWSVSMMPAELGVVASSTSPITIELSREYFSHGGRDHVLLRYRVPAFSYDAHGHRVVQWGEGAALTDPGFGTMYWNAALHRAVGDEDGTSGRPYRQMKTLVALDEAGRPMVDPRDIPQTAALMETFHGRAAHEVLGFVDGVMPDHTPLLLASALDIMALSIAEDSPNQLGEVTSQLVNGSNGNLATKPPAHGGGTSGSSSNLQQEAASSANQLGYIDKGVATLNALGADRQTVLLFTEIEGFRETNQALSYQLKAAMARQERYLQIVEEIAKDGKGTLDPDQWHLFKVNAQQIKALEKEIEATGQASVRLAAKLEDVPANKLGQLMEAFGKSPAAGALSTFSHLMNLKSTVGAAGNIATAATTNLGSGTLPLSRPYDASTPMVLGLDLLGMFANLAAGDVGAAISDATALGTTSVADLFVSLKGLRDINRIKREATELGTELARRQGEQKEALRRQSEEAYNAEIAELDAEIARLDTLPDVRELSRQRLAELRARRELQRQLEEEALAEANAEAKLPVWTSEPTAEEWERFHREITAAMEPDYPTVSAADRARISAEAEARREAARQSELARQAFEAAVLAADIASTAATREAKLREARQIAEQAMARRAAERERRAQWLAQARDRGLEVSKLIVSEFDIEPIEFEGPTWDPPEWFPPEWVPPEFDPPEISEIAWTNFGDDDYPGTGNLAFDYLEMTGTVATDLSRWDDWLATQNVRLLERLALQTGYPNLASALADAENIIHQSQDDGYRRWAMQAPSCGGYVGCGPNYLERWQMKTSLVALGDILAASRGIFSTGGFSDIGISSTSLAYRLRDHGTQDGDIVQITIQQFGRVIYEGRTTLTNAGEMFNLGLQRGVASLSIYAENEGLFSPNTAQIGVDNVVRGESTQTYNLNTGQTATLRIETNVPGMGN